MSSEVKRWRKKPLEVDAMRFEGGPLNATQVIDWILKNGGTARWHEASPAHDYLGDAAREHLSIDTREGTMRGFVGDWIIREPAPNDDRRFYPCKPDIFEATYEPVEETQK